MTDRLSLYNGALRILGCRSIASLTENREPRRVLDGAWDNGFLRSVLEQGEWAFAMRSLRIDYDPDYTPAFGYTHVFEKPNDWVRTAAICSDESYTAPVTRYADEAGFLFSDLDTLYVRYVSDDASFGGDFSRWPESFSSFAELSLADMVSSRLLQNQQREDRIKRDLKKALNEARSRDAMGRPAKFPPRGAWVRARQGNRFYDPAEGR